MIIIPFGDPNTHGTLANTVVYQRRRGQVMCRKYVTHKDVGSAEQLNVRGIFSRAVTAWQASSESVKDNWRAKASGMVMTGYNLFIRDYLVYTPPSTTPLEMLDLERMRIIVTAGTVPTSWGEQIFPQSGFISAGSVFDNRNRFNAHQTHLPFFQSIVISFFQNITLINIPAGYTLEITFDGGKKQICYFPELVGVTSKFFYPADDGSTYYDQAMTNLAYPAP